MSELNIKHSPPDQTADSNRWITWFELVKEDFGDKKAKDAMTRAWPNRVGSAAKTSELRSYFKKEGLNFDVGAIGNVSSDISDTTAGIIGGVGSFFNMGKNITIVLGVILLIMVAFVLYRLARPETVGAIASARTGGMR